jgi:hypothetical protein
MAGRGHRAEQIGLRLAFAVNFILRRPELGLRRRQGGAVAVDLRPHPARQGVQAGEQYYDDENRQHDGKKSKCGSAHN